MSQFEGSLATKLDVGDMNFPAPMSGGRTGLRLTQPGGVLRGPDKYDVLAHRRRQAQIKARRLLELMEGQSR